MNILDSLFTFIEGLYNYAQQLYDWLTTTVTIGSYSFVPLYGVLAVIGGLLVLWLIKKIVPVL